MLVVVLLLAVILGVGLGLLAAVTVLRRPGAPASSGDPMSASLTAAMAEGMTAAVAAVQEQAAADRDAAVHAALHQAAVLQRQQLDQVAAHHRGAPGAGRRPPA